MPMYERHVSIEEMPDVIAKRYMWKSSSRLRIARPITLSPASISTLRDARFEKGRGPSTSSS